MNARALVKISGRVQGVCFRMVAEEEASAHNLTGWIRNLSSGQVEAMFEGEKFAVEEMIAWCHKGPSAARVDSVEVSWETYCGDFHDFRVVTSS